MQETDSIDEWYRNAKSGLEADPGPESWDRLQDSLDVSDVWDRLSVSLDKSKRRAAGFRFYSLIAASVVLLIGLSVWFIPSGRELLGQRKMKNDTGFGTQPASRNGSINHPANQNGVSAQQPAPNPSNGMTVPAADSSNTAQANTANDHPHNTKHSKKQQPGVSDPAATANSAKVGQAAHQDPANAGFSNDSAAAAFRLLASRKELLPFVPALLPFAVKTTYENSLATLPDTTPLKSKPARIYLYAFTGGRATWLLNEATYKALRPKTSDHLLPSLSPVAGVGFGKALYKNISLQTSLYLLSSGGQHYIGYNDSTVYDQQLRFHYAGISCSAVFASPKPLLKTSPYNRLEWTTGFYFGLLHSAEVITTPEPAAARLIKKDNFRNFDGGITAGARCSFRMKNGMVLSPGLQVNQGLVNIYKGSGDVPASFNRTFHTQIEGTIQLRFRLRR